MDRPLSVLVIEDNQADFLQVERHLQQDDVQAACCRVASLEELNTAIGATAWDVVLADDDVPGLDFLDGFHVIQARLPHVPVILMSGVLSAERASDLLKLGVSDFVLKANLPRLRRAIEQALRASAQASAKIAAERASRPTILGIVREVTGKKRAEEAFRQATAETVLANQKRARHDTVVIVSLFALFMFASYYFNWFGSFFPWSPEMGSTATGPVVVALRLLALSWIVYTVRRRRDTRIEVAARLRAEDALRDLQGALESRVRRRTLELSRTNDALAGEIAKHAGTLVQLQEAERIAGIGSWEWTIATGTILWSEGLNHLLARGRGSLAPTFETLPSFYTPDSWERLNAAITSSIETGEPYELELEMIRAGGGACWTTTRGEAMREADGTVVKLRGSVHNVTERRQAEESLRLQGAALRAAADAIVITDSQGTIQWVNPAFEALSGYTAAEAVGNNPRLLLKSGVHDQAFYKNLWDTALAGAVWRGEMTNRRKDGSLYPEEMVVTPVRDTRGEVTHLVAIKRDLTEEKSAEARFLQSQKMEVVGRLAGGIAHDFNNLLTVINGTAELASADLEEGNPLRADLEEIQRAGIRASSLTRQLLAFSRKQIMHAEVLNLDHHVAGLRSMLQRLIGEDITLVVTPETGEARVKADAGQIEQVVMNLVVNARDAMPNGGVLTITTENVELDETHAAAIDFVRPGPHVRLILSDTGSGMDDETRRRAFEPFFTTKEQGKGTGLGLSTVHGIVTQSGGGITVDSELGRGTTFTIYLPRVTDVMVASQPIVTGPDARATGSILVVEDEDGVRHLARRMLQSLGYTVLTAGDAAEALWILEHHEGPVDLMLTDVVMPAMSGPELAEQVARIRPEMGILFSSGHTDNAALRASLLHGDVNFISKPYVRVDMMRKIRETLDSGRARKGMADIETAFTAPRPIDS